MKKAQGKSLRSSKKSLNTCRAKHQLMNSRRKWKRRLFSIFCTRTILSLKRLRKRSSSQVNTRNKTNLHTNLRSSSVMKSIATLCSCRTSQPWRMTVKAWNYVFRCSTFHQWTSLNPTTSITKKWKNFMKISWWKFWHYQSHWDKIQELGEQISYKA